MVELPRMRALRIESWCVLFVGGAAVVCGYWVAHQPLGFAHRVRLAGGITTLSIVLQLAGLCTSSGRAVFFWLVPWFAYNILLVLWSPQENLMYGGLPVPLVHMLLLLIALLVPLVVGMVVALSRGAWLAGMGGALLLFVATFSLTVNARGFHGALGFLSGWLE